MQISNNKKLALFITDIDNTIFDWVSYYVNAMQAMLYFVSAKTGVATEILASEARSVFARHKSIEYPFLIQELPSVNAYYGHHLDDMLQQLVDPAREEFKRVGLPLLKPYDGVSETFTDLKRLHPDTPVVALTDAPRYVAMWKLNKLGVLHHFDAIYGLADPRLPTDTHLGRVKVDPRILLKHLQQSNFGYAGKIRILPDEYEKPGTRGLKTVLMDFDIDENAEAKSRTVWVGDNLRKDVGLGVRVGLRTMWAKYGTVFDQSLLTSLHAFSPAENVHKNVALNPASDGSPKPDAILDQFSDILAYV